jgi:hypothetical protein
MHAIDKAMAADTLVFQGFMFMFLLPSFATTRINLRAWGECYGRGNEPWLNTSQGNLLRN